MIQLNFDVAGNSMVSSIEYVNTCICMSQRLIASIKYVSDTMKHYYSFSCSIKPSFPAVK